MCSVIFDDAVRLWKEWNSKINVISRKDMDSIYLHHIVHSIAIAEYMKESGIEASSVLDVGTGGGFPGIPLAVVLPEVSFLLCDSIGKKTMVASAVAEGLGLNNVKVVNSRAEAIDGSFDFVVSRAVASLANLYPWVKDKYTKGMLLLKGGDVEAEISDLCRICKVDRSKISVWPLRSCNNPVLPEAKDLSDDYFEEKFVIHIRK